MEGDRDGLLGYLGRGDCVRGANRRAHGAYRTDTNIQGVERLG